MAHLIGKAESHFSIRISKYLISLYAQSQGRPSMSRSFPTWHCLSKMGHYMFHQLLQQKRSH